MSASIKSIYIEDFQSHEKTKIELPGPGQLCVIVGPTDSGKTAIVRALRLLCYNAPQGSDYIRVGRDRATVALEMSDGTKVARERSRGSINRYRVTKPGESPTVLEGFGVSVPVEVQEATGVRVVSIGETLDLALNLSEQLDGPFLGKSVSGPAKAKILGALAGTEEVDEAQRGLGTDLHRAGQEENRLKTDIEGLAEKIAEYAYLPELAQKIEALEDLVASAQKAQDRLCALKTLQAQLGSITAHRIGALNTLARWSGLKGAMSHAQTAEDAVAKERGLCTHRSTLTRIHEDHSKWYTLAHVRWAGLDAGIATYEGLETAWHRRKTLKDLGASLAATRAGIAKCQAVLSRWQYLEDAQCAYTEAQDGAYRLLGLTGFQARLGGILDAQLTAGRAYGRWNTVDDAAEVASGVPTLAERLTTLVRSLGMLTAIRQARVIAEDSLSQHSKALCDAQRSYADTLVSLGTCPLCGSTVSPDSIKTHIEEVA